MVKIALDAGHGRSTSGKRTPDGIAEWVLNSAVAEKAEKLFSNYKDVDVIRLDDTTGKTDVNLSARMNKAVSNDVDILISIHHNAESGVSGKNYGTATGVEIWISNAANSTTKSIASSIISKFATKAGMRNRGVKTSSGLVMVKVKPFPTMLVEGGFMNAKPDRTKLQTASYQDAYAEAIVEAVAAQFKLSKKSATSVTKKATTTKKTDSTSGYYTSCNLNLRKSPSSNGELIITIPKDTKVTVLDKSSSWYKVKVTIKKKTYTGYAFGKTYINKK